MKISELIEELETIKSDFGNVECPTETCEWKPNFGWYDEVENYDTACGNAFTIMNGSPSENKMTFCCYCGKKIKVSGR